MKNQLLKISVRASLITMLLSVIVSANSIYAQAIVMHRVSPNNAGMMNYTCGSSFTVTLRVMKGNVPVSGEIVNWSSEEGTMSSASSITDGSGFASSTHTVGTSNGIQYHINATSATNTNQMFWQVMPNCGSAACEASVVCKNVSIELDANGTASITAADIDGGSTLCGNSLTLFPYSFNCSNVGNNAVTLSLINNGGQVLSSCISNVTVLDNVFPVAIAQNITVQLDATGNASIAATQIDNGSYDACGIASLSVSPNSFTCGNVGDNTVTLTVTDNHGNVSTETATVNIQDNIAPIAVAQSITVQLDATGNASIAAAQIDNASSDACGIASLSVSPNSFTCGNVGDNTVTLTVTDNHGNVSTQTATATVVDNIAPNVVTQNVSVTLSGGSASITATQVDNGSSDACGIASLSVSPNSFTCANIGNNTVTLTVTDNHGNVSSQTATINVIGAIPVAIINASRNPVYYGYAPYSTSILTASGGVSNSWNTGATTASITVAPTSTSSYSVTVTNVYGCTASTDITIDVIDVRCGTKLDKVSICQGTGSAKNPFVNICVSTNAVAALLAKGDRLGNCNTTRSLDLSPESDPELAFNVYPNPNNGMFNLSLPNVPNEGTFTVKVFNTVGQIVYEEFILFGQKSSWSINMPSETQSGLYIMTIEDRGNVFRKTVSITK